MSILQSALILALLAPVTAHAGGFILNDHGAKAAGRADAVVATVEDGSSIFYNPGGIGFAEGVNINIGGTMILPRVSFTDARTDQETDAVKKTTITPNFYAFGQITDIVKVGFGFYTPFGSATEWPASSPGREQSREATLRTFFFSPVVAADLSKFVPGKLAIGGGIDIVPATVDLKRDILFGDTIGTVHLGGRSIGFGGRIGVRYSPMEKLDLGVAYRSAVKLDFNGDADFDIEDPFRVALPPDGDIKTTVKMPQSVLAGVAYRVMPNLELEFDINWIDWRSFESLDIELPDGTANLSPYDWNDVLVLRFGAEYSLPNLGLDVRGGYAYDPTPSPGTTLGFAPPDADRHNISVGGSYQLPNNFYVDLGFLYGLPVSNTTSSEPFAPVIKGKFDITFFVTALTLGYQFGGPAPAVSTPAAVVADNG